MEKKNLMVTKEETQGGGINQELGINTHTLPYIRQITNKDRGDWWATVHRVA